MVGRREATCTDPGKKLELTLELADLYSKKLAQPQAVIPLLERDVHLCREGQCTGVLGLDAKQLVEHLERARPIAEPAQQTRSLVEELRTLDRFAKRQPRGDQGLEGIGVLTRGEQVV